MGVVEFEIERTINAPVDQVFARLSDIEGHNEWMPKKGSIRRHTRQTSSGVPALGTTYVDQTVLGATPGEVVEFDAPHRLTYHWWNASRSGRVEAEGWPSYSLEATGENSTRLRHQATMHTHGLYRLATPILRRIALRERTTIMDALKASFEARG